MLLHLTILSISCSAETIFISYKLVKINTQQPITIQENEGYSYPYCIRGIILRKLCFANGALTW